jgi:flagellar assembly factor FliW
MQINTTRFGTIEIKADDILLFPSGLAGFEACRHWVLLEDSANEAVGWLQSISDAAVALPVVSPRRFLPDYQVRIARNQLSLLQLSAVDEAYILAVVSKNESRFTLNLRAPIIINLDRRMGRQVLTTDEQPLQFELGSFPAAIRKIA